MCIARFSYGKANAHATVVKGGEGVADMGQSCFGGVDVLGVEVFAKGVGNDAEGLYGVACGGERVCKVVALCFALCESGCPCGLVRGEGLKDGDGANATEVRVGEVGHGVSLC